MHEIRQKIEAIDEKLIELVAKRMALSKKLGQIKKETNKAVIDPRKRKTATKILE